MRRAPSSQDDLEIWRVLDRRFGDESTLVRKRCLEAGEARRCKQVTLEDYFRMLESSTRFSRGELAAMAGVTEQEWLRWLLAEDDVIPTVSQLERLVENAALSRQEAAHLLQLREATVKEAQQPSQPGLADYLRREPRSLGPALAKVRLRKGFTVDQVAQQAGVAGEQWARWEEGRELPGLAALDQVLKKLHWIWATDDALRGWTDEVPAPADSRLSKAFFNDHEWEESDSQENWLIPSNPTPEAVAAWREVELQRARLRESKPDPELEAIKALGEERLRAESTLGGFLRFRRETKGSSVEEMAAKAGVKVSTWVAWESGQTVPTLHELEMVASRVFATVWLRERVLEIWHGMCLTGGA